MHPLLTALLIVFGILAFGAAFEWFIYRKRVDLSLHIHDD